MLYDAKRWSRPTVISVEGLIDWLETQPAAGRYDWPRTRKCLLGRWFLSMGMDGPTADRLCQAYSLTLPYLHIAHSEPWTFGAALERARKYTV